MAYTVTARKWRPMTFKDVVGQNHVVKTLENAINLNRIAHSYLLSGPRGIGKTSTARILAKSLNCENGPTIEPCNKCSNCIEITESRSLDVLEIDGASNRGIDEIRNLRQNVRYVPVKGGYKIYIIDEVHMLTTQAFNALLKTLEEPPEKVVFIFATTQPHQVPATIHSRCQRFDFKRIPINEIQDQLKMICKAEGISIDDDSLLIITKKADGSMRDAQSILDQIVSYCSNNVTLETVISILGIVNQELFFEITDAIKSKDLKRGLDLAQKIIYEGYELEGFFIGLIDHFRNILVAKITNSSDMIETSENYKSKYMETAHHLKEDDILRLISITTASEREIKRSPQPQIRLEITILKMVQMERSVNIEELFKKIDELRKDHPGETESYKTLSKPESLNLFNSKKKNDKPPPLQVTEPSQVKESISEQLYKTIELKDVLDKWDEILSKIEAEKPSVGAFMREGQPSAVNGKKIEITFPQKNGFQVSLLQNNKRFIDGIFEEIFHNKLIISFEMSSTMQTVPNVTERTTKENSTLRIDEIKKKEPIVNDLMEMFDCKIKNIIKTKE